MATETATETKAALTRALKDVGLNKADFNTMRSGYDGLKSESRVKADIDHWLKFGKGADKIKRHLESDKTNLNSGTFGTFCGTYFPLFSVQDRSNAIWLWNNQKVVETFSKGKSLSNPASVKQAIRKDLVESTKELSAEDTTKAYDAYGMSPPKSKGADVRKDGQTGEVTKLSNIDTLKGKDLLPLLQHVVEAIGKQVQKNAKQFSTAQLNELEKISFQLADIQVNADTKNGVIRTKAA